MVLPFYEKMMLYDHDTVLILEVLLSTQLWSQQACLQHGVPPCGIAPYSCPGIGEHKILPNQMTPSVLQEITAPFAVYKMTLPCLTKHYGVILSRKYVDFSSIPSYQVWKQQAFSQHVAKFCRLGLYSYRGISMIRTLSWSYESKFFKTWMRYFQAKNIAASSLLCKFHMTVEVLFNRFVPYCIFISFILLPNCIISV